MKTCITLVVVLGLAVGASADTFTSTIVLPAGNVVAPGEVLPVEIHGILTDDDPGNDGLAFFSMDFAMTGPSAIHLPDALQLSAPADGSMNHFLRPLGIDASYEGTAVGDMIIQAGGAQNTFGNNPAVEPFLEFPAGEFIDLNIALVDQILLQGSLTLPPEAGPGVYTLTIQALQANVLSDGQTIESFGRYFIEPASVTTDAVDIIIPQSADLDGDGSVDVVDLLILLANWGACPSPCPPQCPVDLNSDCSVGVTDLLILLSYWS